MLNISNQSFNASLIIDGFFFGVSVVVFPDSHIHVPLIIGNDVLDHTTYQVNANGFEVLSKIEEKYILGIQVEEPSRKGEIEPHKR